MEDNNQIRFNCPNCNTKYVARREQAGKTGKCKNCGRQIVVPEAAPQQTADTSTPNKESKIWIFRNTSTLVKALTVSLILFAVASAIAIWSDSLEIELLKSAINGSNISEMEAEANDTRQALLGFIQVGLYFLIMFLFMRWIYLANVNARALGAKNMKFTPGWSVGWFFVPIAYLFKPYQAFKEIWQASASSEQTNWRNLATSPVLPWWWTFWIISLVLSQLSLRLSTRAEGIQEILTASQITLFSDLIDIPLSILAIMVVRRIHSLQQEKHRILEGQEAYGYKKESIFINALVKMMNALAVPIGLLNLLGGVVSGIWLAILGEWWAIGYGIGAMFISTFGLSIALMPSMIFAAPTAYFAEKRNKLGTFFFALLANLYDITVIAVWCGAVLYFFARQAESNTVIPLLLWSYGVATGPLTYMAQKEQQAGESVASIIAAFFAEVGYLIMILMVLFFRVSLIDVLVVFGLVMFVGLILQFRIAIEEMDFAKAEII